MKILGQVLFILLANFTIVSAQSVEKMITHFNETVQLHNEASIHFNEAMSYWKSRGTDYEKGIENLIKFRDAVKPILVADPSLEYDIIKLNATSFKDMCRRYIRFMINCDRNRPEVCKSYDCLNLAWEMTENIKSLNLRYEVAKSGIRRDSIFGLNESHSYNFSSDYKYTSIEELKSRLKKNELFVSFLMTDNRRPVYAWIIRKDEPIKVIRLGVNTAELFFRIEHIQAIYKNDESWQEVLELLNNYEDNDHVDGRKPYPPQTKYPFTKEGTMDVFSEKVLKPLNVRKNERLIISPDQNMSSIPFNALRYGLEKTYLYKNSEIVFTPSAKFFIFLNDNVGIKHNIDAKHYVGFALGGDIPYTVDEVENISNYLFPKSVAINEAFTEDRFNKDVFSIDEPEKTVLHIASHSVVVKDTFGVKHTAIVSHATRDQDGYLLTNNFDYVPSDLSMIVISGCEVSPTSDVKDYFLRIISNFRIMKGEKVSLEASNLIPRSGGTTCICSYGETFSSLISGIIAAKPNKIISSQWQVNDELTTEFFDLFYQYLDKNKSPWQALSQTMDDMNYLDINLWATFIQIGR